VLVKSGSKWIGEMFAALFLCASTIAVAAFQPNVIVVLTDDQGYADAGFQGFPASKDVLTPNLDRLAASGTVFHNGYVAFSTCGPSRASLLTGRSASRFGIEENDIPVPTSEISIARALEPLGYATGAFGKWHLGEGKGETPTGRGFDYYWGDIPAPKDYFMKRLVDPPCWKDGSEGPRGYGRYVTDAYTDEAVQFIKRNKDKPFFAYVAYNAPHSPFRVYEDLVKRVVDARPKWKPVYERMKSQGKFPAYDFGPFKGADKDEEILRLCYLGMLLAADDGVGKILQTLENEGLRDKTLIFYMSDNGAALSRPNDLGGVNLPLRSGKGSVYDGGCRVPYVMSWPGTIPAGKTSELMVSSMDIFSTAVELAGGTVPSDRIIDGVNLIPYITGVQTGPAHEYLFFRRKGRNAWSIRSGDYKWVWNPAKRKSRDIGDPFLGPESNPEGGFYDIQNHLSEDVDLSSQFPERKEELISLYKTLAGDLPEPRIVNGGTNEND